MKCGIWIAGLRSGRGNCGAVEVFIGMKSDVLNYASPEQPSRRYRWGFWIGFAVGEVLMLGLVGMLAVGGPMLPMNLAYPHVLLPIEMGGDRLRALPEGLGLTLILGHAFVAAPCIYGCYGLAMVSRRKGLWIAVAVVSHLVLVMVVACMRDAFMFLR